MTSTKESASARRPELTRILLVDDSPYFLQAASEFLCTQETIQAVVTAKEGEEALAQLQWFEPDIILLDLNLSDRSGLDLIPLFRARTNRAHIIILTNMNDDSYRTAALRAGADCFVYKPEMGKTLMPVIASMLQGDSLQQKQLPTRIGSVKGVLSEKHKTRPRKAKKFGANGKTSPSSAARLRMGEGGTDVSIDNLNSQ